jgi:VanZ family protein
MRARVLRILHLAGVYLFWPGVALVTWGELRQGGGLANIPDKVQHFVAYGGLAGMAVLGVGERRHAMRIATALIVMGAVLEILQALVGRDASYWDEVANAAGALCGAFTAVWLMMVLKPLQSRDGPGETGQG